MALEIEIDFVLDGHKSLVLNCIEKHFNSSKYISVQLFQSHWHKKRTSNYQNI